MPERLRHTLSTFRHELSLLFVVLVWGVNFPVLKATLAVMPLLVVNAFRFVVSALVLGILYALRRPRDRSAWYPIQRYGWQIIGLGLLGYVFYQFAFIYGLNFTTAGSAALIMASSPLWTALLGRVRGLERLNGLAWTGLLVSLAGTLVVVLGGADAVATTGIAFFGNVLMLGASVCWGLYTALNKPLLGDVSPVGLTFFGLLVALPFLFGAAVPVFGDVAWEQVGWWAWAAIVFSGGLSTGLAFVIWNSAVKHTGASQTAAYANLVPFVALFSGFLFLGEPIFWIQIVGGACIIGGLVLMRRARRSRMPVA